MLDNKNGHNALKAVEAGNAGGIWWLDAKGIPRFKRIDAAVHWRRGRQNPVSTSASSLSAPRRRMAPSIPARRGLLVGLLLAVLMIPSPCRSHLEAYTGNDPAWARSAHFSVRLVQSNGHSSHRQHRQHSPHSHTAANGHSQQGSQGHSAVGGAAVAMDPEPGVGTHAELTPMVYATASPDADLNNIHPPAFCQLHGGHFCNRTINWSEFGQDPADSTTVVITRRGDLLFPHDTHVLPLAYVSVRPCVPVFLPRPLPRHPSGRRGLPPA